MHSTGTRQALCQQIELIVKTNPDAMVPPICSVEVSFLLRKRDIRSRCTIFASTSMNPGPRLAFDGHPLIHMYIYIYILYDNEPMWSSRKSNKSNQIELLFVSKHDCSLVGLGCRNGRHLAVDSSVYFRAAPFSANSCNSGSSVLFRSAWLRSGYETVLYQEENNVCFLEYLHI